MTKLRLTFQFLNFIHRRCFVASPPGQKRICIVGSGPAGFYTAKSLLQTGHEVDIYEKLPVPFGLIRYGVAPDHTEIKNVISSFSQIANHKLCKYFGNVNVGKEVTISELLDTYHAVVLAYGSEKDKKLNIPGEESKNVLSARDFVSWYNGHPHFFNIDINLDCETALVVGHGNVALDVSRILLQSADVLKKTDMSEYALEQLKKSRIKRVIMAGRRGPLQVAFTIKEFRAITKLPNLNIMLHCEDFEGFDDQFMSSLERPMKRLQELMFDCFKREHHEQNKCWDIKFYRNPKAALSDSQGQVEKFLFGVNKLKELDRSKPLKIVETGEEETIDCGLVLKSVGYRSVQIDPSIPLDTVKNLIPNQKGRVANRTGLYCSGWLKTGPRGVLAPTMDSSKDTSYTILDDISSGKLNRSLSMEREDLLNLLKNKGVKYVTFEDWKRIDKVEEERGKEKGKVRDKLYTIEDMLNAAKIS